MKTEACTVGGCDKPVFARAWCARHWTRWRRHGDPLGGGTSHGEPLRFYHEVVLTDERDPDDDCLIWPFANNGVGYGLLLHEGEEQLVTRLICTEVYGPPPTPDHEAAHSCNRGKFGCCTKGHLRWATKAENQADRLIHDTHRRGSRHTLAKLSEEDVLTIRRLHGSVPQREIAEAFEVSESRVSRIISREAWGWL